MTRRVSDMTPEQHAIYLAVRKKYRIENPEKVRAARAKYKKAHPEKVRASHARTKKRRALARPEADKAKRARYRERYPERFKAVKKLSKQRTRDQMSDGYIREQLGVKNAPQELIELKRAHLKLRRQLRTMK
jgi:hypothetical protein